MKKNENQQYVPYRHYTHLTAQAHSAFTDCYKTDQTENWYLQTAGRTIFNYLIPSINKIYFKFEGNYTKQNGSKDVTGKHDS